MADRETHGLVPPEVSVSTVKALERLADVLERTSEELERLAARAHRLRGALSDGMPLTDAMDAEPRPLIITRMTELLDDLTGAALGVRRTEARQLQLEGLSHQRIAEVFGVSRQRVGALLAHGHDDAGRRPHRPRRHGLPGTDAG